MRHSIKVRLKQCYGIVLCIFSTAQMQWKHLGAGGVGGHGSVSSHHEGQSTDELTVRLDLSVSGQVNTDVAAPTEDDVEVSISDGELVAHKVLVTVQQVLGDVVELGADLLDLSLLGLTLKTVEQRAIGGVNLAGKVVEGVLHQISLFGSVLACDLARSLCVLISGC